MANVPIQPPVDKGKLDKGTRVGSTPVDNKAAAIQRLKQKYSNA